MTNDNAAKVVTLPASDKPWITRVNGHTIVLTNPDHPPQIVAYTPGQDLRIEAPPLTKETAA